jgi:uncharacterized protein
MRHSEDSLNLSSGTKLKRLSTDSAEEVAVLAGSPLSSEGCPLDDDAARPHVIYFYGNAMSLSVATYEFSLFRAFGCNVWIPDYVGYGQSTGKGKASERGCYETATAVYRYLTTELNILPERIVAIGWSLGAAVAIDLASRLRIAGLIALSPFTSIDAMVHRLLPSWLPVSMLLSERFDNLNKIALITTCPILIGHGTSDQLIPFSMGQKLANVARKRVEVTFLPVEGAEHNDILSFGDPQLLEGMSKFIEEACKANKPL